MGDAEGPVRRARGPGGHGSPRIALRRPVDRLRPSIRTSSVVADEDATVGARALNGLHQMKKHVAADTAGHDIADLDDAGVGGLQRNGRAGFDLRGRCMSPTRHARSTRSWHKSPQLRAPARSVESDRNQVMPPVALRAASRRGRARARTVLHAADTAASETGTHDLTDTSGDRWRTGRATRGSPSRAFGPRGMLGRRGAARAILGYDRACSWRSSSPASTSPAPTPSASTPRVSIGAAPMGATVAPARMAGSRTRRWMHHRLHGRPRHLLAAATTAPSGPPIRTAPPAQTKPAATT